jgi:ribonuclease HII
MSFSKWVGYLVTEGTDFWFHEKAAVAEGFRVVAGVDEAGRGPLAGPVVAAAVVLPFCCDADGIDDSKKLTPAQRDELFDRIQGLALGIGVGIVGPEEIDRINILQATYLAMKQAIRDLNMTVDLFLVDGSPIRDFGHPNRCIVGGDGLSASIAAASIVAKVTRDRIMCEYDAEYPQYGFAQHKGYGTKEHMQSLAIHGVCAIHRRSFAPCSGDPTLFLEAPNDQG